MKTWGKQIYHWALVVMTGLSLASPADAGTTRDEVSNFIQEGEYSTTSRNGRIVAKVDSKKRTVVRRVVKSAPKNRAPASVTRKVPARKVSVSRKPASVSKKQSVSKNRPNVSKNRRVVAKPVRPATRKPASVKNSHVKKHASKKFVAKKSTAKKSVAKKTKKSYEKKIAKKPTPSSRRPASKRSRVPEARPTRRERDMPFVSVPRSRVRREDKMFVMDDPGAGPKAMRPDPDVVGEEPSTIDRPVERTPAENPAMAAPTETVQAPGVVPEAAPEDVAAAVREPDVFDLHSGKDPMRPTPGN